MSGGGGRRGIAPCGHPGEYVIGNFVLCLLGCGKDEDEDDFSDLVIEDEDTQPEIEFFTTRAAGDTCPHCGSDDVEDFGWYAHGAASRHCLPCGKVFP